LDRRKKGVLCFVLSVLMVFISGCRKSPDGSNLLVDLPVDNMKNIISKSDVTFVKDVSKDGNGCIRIDVDKAKFIKLYEIDTIDLEHARLKYKAEVKTENFSGDTFLEMWCTFEGKGRYFSRGLDNTLSGTNDWTTLETFFLLRKGENPDKVELDLVVNGNGGTIWVDAIRLEKDRL
jgi:hypothetical protein